MTYTYLYKIFHRSLLILLLMYFYIQVTNYSMQFKISDQILPPAITDSVPIIFYHLLFFIVIFLIAGTLNTVSIPITFIVAAFSSILFTITLLIITNILELNDYTFLQGITVYHPIPIEKKKLYLAMQIADLLNTYSINDNALLVLHAKWSFYLQDSFIQPLNGHGLQQYAHKMIFESYELANANKINLVQGFSTILSTIAFINSICKIFDVTLMTTFTFIYRLFV